MDDGRDWSESESESESERRQKKIIWFRVGRCQAISNNIDLYQLQLKTTSYKYYDLTLLFAYAKNISIKRTKQKNNWAKTFLKL